MSPTNPSTTEAGDAATVARRVELISRIVQVRGAFEHYPIQPTGELQPAFARPVAGAQVTDANHVTAVIEMGYELTCDPPEGGATGPKPDSAPEQALVGRVKARFVVLYELSDGPTPSSEDLAAFARENGVFNITPFWREFLHSSLMRAGLPTILAPVMKLDQPDADESADQA